MTDLPTATTTGSLGAAEAMRLESLEERIETGLATFQLVGSCLLAIRDDRLYRATHRTFEAYLDERWGMSRQRGYQLIEAAQVVVRIDGMSTIVDIPAPSNESQTRPLKKGAR